MEAASILARYDAGEISGEIALMELLIACEDAGAVERLVRAHGSPALLRLAEGNAAGCSRIAGMLASGMDSPEPAPDPKAGIAMARRLFDWSVQQSEEASVALYSLGNPSILEQATREIVALFESWGLLGPACVALQIGCGIGRLEQALSPRVAAAHGVDISPNMIAAARRRCADLANVHLATTSGEDLRQFADRSFSLVYAVDSFPYLVQAGRPLVETHFAEAARVLAPGGELCILNYSYRGLEEDRAEVPELAAAHGFAVLANGERPFRLWSGAAFRLRLR